MLPRQRTASTRTFVLPREAVRPLPQASTALQHFRAAARVCDPQPPDALGAGITLSHCTPGPTAPRAIPNFIAGGFRCGAAHEKPAALDGLGKMAV